MRYLIILIILFIANSVLAQEWSLVTPVKTSSDIRGVYMVDNDTGFVLDKLERRVLKTTDGGYGWERMHYYMSYQPNDLWMTDANNGVICASSGRFYKTTDGFQSYTQITGSSVTTMYSLYFTDPDSGYAAGENGVIMKTTDAGSTWSTLTTGITDLLFNVFFVDDTTGFACGNSGRIIKTTDAGNSWSTLTTGTTSRFYDVFFSDVNNGIAVGAWGNYMKTTDGGATWTSPASPSTQNMYNLRYSAGVLLMLCGNGEILRSSNFGNTWTTINAGPDDHYVAHMNSNGVGFCGGDATLYKTIDYGVSWTLIKANAPHSLLTKVSFADNNHGLSVGYMTTGGNQNAIIRTSDGGHTWTTELVNSSSNAGILGCHILPNGEGAIGGSSGLNAHTNNFGDNFTYGSNQPSVAIRAVWAFSENKYLVGGGYVNSGVYLTEDAGYSWAHSSGGTIQDFYFPSDSVGYAVGDGGAVMKTTDQAATWTPLSTGQFSDYYTVVFLDDSLGYVAGSNGGRKTTDGGQTWTAIFPSGSYIYSLLFITADSGYAVTYGGDVTKTIDGGVTWTPFANGKVDQGLRDAAIVNNEIIAVGSRGDVFVMPLTCLTPLPTPVITQNGDTLFSSASANNQWYNMSGPIAGANDTLHVPSANGEYYVVVEDPFGCVSDSSNHITVVFTGTVDVEGPAWNVYPNPAVSIICVEGVKIREITVLDINGRVIQNVFPNAEKALLDISGQTDGVYFLRITGETDTEIQKVLISSQSD